MLSENSVGVYLDSDTCLFHFNRFKEYFKFNDEQHYFIKEENLDKFIVSERRIKFSTFHVPFTNEITWVDRLYKTLNCADHVFVFCSELHQHTVNQLISLDLPKISIFICGFINHEFKSAKIYRWMDWFTTTTDFYKEVEPNLLQKKLKFDLLKPKFFDILLGCKRVHRDFVYNFINDNKLNDKVIMTYYQKWNVDLRETDHIFETDGLEFLPESNYTHTVHQVLYYNRKTNLSQVIPFTIYNESYYSIVAETNAVNEFNFYTEKVDKLHPTPMQHHRPGQRRARGQRKPTQQNPVKKLIHIDPLTIHSSVAILRRVTP